MTDIETETERWEGQVSDEWRRETIWWLRATPNEDLRKLINKAEIEAEDRMPNEEFRAGVSYVVSELQELIEDE